MAIESQNLINECVQAIDELQIRTPKVIVTKARLDLDSDDSFHAIQLSSAKTFVDLAGRYPIPNLAELIMHLLENTTPPVRISKKTIVEIFSKTINQNSALDNPFEFASAVAKVIKEKLTDYLINGIQYQKTSDWYELSLFKDSFDSWEDNVVPAEHSLYDKIEYDSDVEKGFVEGLEKIDQVKMYVKLPSWFKVRTPIGEYNPDWAIVWEDRDEHGSPTGKPLLYLVRETKSTTELGKLRPDEKRKIMCGEKHFQDALHVSFKVVTSPKELP